MVYGVLRLINFAHGDVFMVGSYAALFLAVSLHCPLLIILPLTFIAIGALGLSSSVWPTGRCEMPRASQRSLRPLPSGFSSKTIMLATVGPEPKKFPALIITTVYSFGSFTTTNLQIMIITVSIVLMMAVDLFVAKTRTGMAMRALSWDKTYAPLLGINVDRIVSVTFALGAGLASIAGIFVGLAYPVIDPYMGIMVGWKAFVSAVIGGIGSIKGAVIGGFLLGAVEILSAAFLPSTFKDMIVFGLLLIILLFKPQGFFGLPVQKKV